jgi:signal transduction histidine kinase
VDRAIDFANAFSFAALAAATLVLAARRRARGLAWLGGGLALLGAVSVVGAVLGPSEGGVSGARLVIVKVVLVGLVLFPLFQYRFVQAAGRTPRFLDGAVVAATVILIAATMALGDLPAPDDPRPPWLLAYVALFVVLWSGVAVVTAAMMWLAGRAQPLVTRRRMQLLAVGSLVLGLVILPSAASPNIDQSSALGILLGLIPLVSVGAYFLGVAPPLWLRAVWRRREDPDLQEVQAQLASALSRSEVAEALLPRIADLCGAAHSALVNHGGRVLGNHGFDATSLAHIKASLARPLEPGSVVEVGDLIALALSDSWLVIQRPEFAPMVGGEELVRLVNLGVFVDLALDRVALFRREREAREAVDAAAKELESLVLGLSHDLRNPMTAITGFVDILQRDETISGDGRLFLERVKANTEFMQSLVDDLLELSRVGRIETEAQSVDLGSVAATVATDSGFPHSVRVEVGALPRVMMNPVRARQLIGNLVGNAVKHSGRDDVTVRVHSLPLPDGGVVVHVDDDGEGIPADKRDQVFAVFERLKGAGGPAGSGIGLSMCRRIVMGFGGAIAAGAPDGEVGARLSVTFPAAAIVGAATPAEVAS